MSIEQIVACIKASKPDLKPSQPSLSIPIINRLCKKMRAGIRFSDIKVDNGIICDGHHRYIASLLTGIVINSVPSVLKSEVGKWESVIFEEVDWDDENKIMRLNLIDAYYNNVPIDQILQIIN